MKPNYLGIIGGILAFVSLALSWWTMTLSSGGISLDVSIYPYMASVGGLGAVAMSLWYGWLALILVIFGGVLGIWGGAKSEKAKSLRAGGALALVAVIVFALGLQVELLQGIGISSSAIYLFGSGTLSVTGTSIDYTAYLSFGFWLALVAAILMFAAYKKRPVEPVMAPQPPPPPPVQL